MGYKVYGLRKSDKQAQKAIEAAPNTLENAYLKATIQPDGTIDLLDKRANHLFTGLLRFEDTGDIGTEYTYIAANAKPVYSGVKPAKIELVKAQDFVTEYKVTVEMEIPKSKDKCHSCIDFFS